MHFQTISCSVTFIPFKHYCPLKDKLMNLCETRLQLSTLYHIICAMNQRTCLFSVSIPLSIIFKKNKHPPAPTPPPLNPSINLTWTQPLPRARSLSRSLGLFSSQDLRLRMQHHRRTNRQHVLLTYFQIVLEPDACFVFLLPSDYLTHVDFCLFGCLFCKHHTG